MNTRDEDIYQEHVLDHFEQPYHRGACATATHRAADDNPLCGDQIALELEVDDAGRICQAWFQGDGCCISQAAASMLMESIEGKSRDEAQGMTADEMLRLFGPKLTPNRQKCCLLCWRVLQSALYSPIKS
jgi:nitrogen fixation NifU-like protein